MGLHRQKLFVVLMMICVSVRIFTGAPEAQVNFAQLIFTTQAQEQLTTPTDRHDVATVQPIIFEEKSAATTPAHPTEHKMYKKYLPPDFLIVVFENLRYHSEQILTSILATSLYLKDLTLKSLTSHAPPILVELTLFTLFIVFLIKRIGVFGNDEQNKNYSNRRFRLQ
jgi:hypothetical protein